MRCLFAIAFFPIIAFGAWEVVKSPVTDDIWDLDFINPSSGWAAAGGTGGGAILRYHGGGWTVNKNFAAPYAVGVIDAYDENCAWAAVQKRNGPTTMYFWDGSSWTPKDVIDDGLCALDIPASNEGWACSYYKVYHWDGLSWHAEGPSHPVGGFHDVKFYGQHYGVIGGDYYCHYLYASGSWSRLSVPNGENFMSVSVPAPNSLWGGGDVAFEFAVIGYYRGGAWRIFEFPELRRVNAISMADDDFGWAAGYDQNLHGNNIYRWDGYTWRPSPCPINNTIRDLVTLSRDDAWAACSSGYFLHYRTGPDVTPTSLGRIKAIFK
jgi:hypothetical protein